MQNNFDAKEDFAQWLSKKKPAEKYRWLWFVWFMCEIHFNERRNKSMGNFAITPATGKPTEINSKQFTDKELQIA